MPHPDILRANQHLLAAVRPVAPRESVPRIAAQARQVADLAARTLPALVAVGVSAALVESLELRIAVLEAAQAEMWLTKVRKGAHEKALTTKALAARLEVLRVAKFAARGRPELARQFSSWVPLVGLSRVMADLRVLADFAEEHRELFAEVGEDGAARSRELLAVCAELEAVVVARREGSLAWRGVVDTRNRAHAWLAEGVRVVKRALGYLESS